MNELSTRNQKKIVILVMNGLRGLPREKGGKTELETARTPNLDALASTAECGMHVPVGFGITAGSAVSHLALFGNDPLQCAIGRGVISAIGIALLMTQEDVAARLDFATLDKDGAISDRLSVGLRVYGVLGAAASFIGFGLPAFLLYAQFHGLPAVVSAFGGHLRRSHG